MECQVASHPMPVGMANAGLEIVRTCRDRYDGRSRGPCMFSAALLPECSVNEPTFQQIARFPVIQEFEESFRRATGVSLALVPPEEPARRRAFGRCENGFCTQAVGTVAGCAACLETQKRAQRGDVHQAGAKQVNCFAGLTDVAVPVIVRGRHLATLMGGQIFRRDPTQRDFELVLKMLEVGQDRAWAARLRKAYFGTPVVTAERFEAIMKLLTIFSKQLVECIDRCATAVSSDEPAAVSTAKRFVRARSDEPITLEQVVEHVRVSRFYFCKLFKRATGLTLTDYVTRVRLEKAKALLVDPSLRISEIVYASGFGSIPRFNSVFKRHLGMAPTAYRMSLRAQLPG